MPDSRPALIFIKRNNIVKHAQLSVGSVYIARVSERMVPVRLDSIREHSKGHYYDVTNLRTTRKLVFRSPQKFRRGPYTEKDFSGYLMPGKFFV